MLFITLSIWFSFDFLLVIVYLAVICIFVSFVRMFLYFSLLFILLICFCLLVYICLSVYHVYSCWSFIYRSVNCCILVFLRLYANFPLFSLGLLSCFFVISAILFLFTYIFFIISFCILWSYIISYWLCNN